MSSAPVVAPRWAGAAPGESAADATRERWRARAKRHGPVLLAFLLYLGGAVYFTWPVILHLNSMIYGGIGDPFGTMGTLRQLIHSGNVPFLPGTMSEFNAPHGLAVPWVRGLASLPGVTTLWLLALIFGAPAGVTLYTFVGFLGTGMTTFLVARRLTGRTWPALIAGWAFAFYPFAVLNGQGHYDNAFGWPLLLGVWRMIELSEAPTRRNALLAGIAVAFGMWWSPYFILFGGVAWATLAVTSLLISWRRGRFREQLAGQAVAGVIVVCFLAGLYALSTQASGNASGVRTNGIQALITYSARPLEYVVPPITNPFFGSKTGPFLEARLHGSNFAESMLYVGVSVILLAVVAAVAAARRRLEPRLARAVLLLAALALVATITSAPPEARLAGHLIPFPSHFIAQLTTTWRAYSRFVIVVMLALSLLAAIGLSALTQRTRRIATVAILAGATIVVPADLWGRLTGRVNPLGVPHTYQVLARLPKGDVAEYPLMPAGDGLYTDIYYQAAYHKPIINGYAEGSAEEARALSLSLLADPATAPRLAALGVKYVELRHAPPGYGLPLPGTPTRDFVRLAEDDYATLYGIHLHTYAIATPEVGFGLPEYLPNGRSQWLLSPSGQLVLQASCSACTGTLSFHLESFARPRQAVLRGPGGRVLWQGLVTAREVSLPIQLHHVVTLTLSSSPGPQSIRAATGVPDPRSVSLQVRAPAVTLTRGGGQRRG
jgi:hypothetical protein